MNKIYLPLMAASLVFLSGCGKQAKTERIPAVEMPAVFSVQEIVGTPIPIPDARKLSPGDEVILTGLIMGVTQPFVEGRAVFVLGDEETLTPCDLKKGDHCKMPWDVCCDPAPVRMAGTATIQILGDDKKPLRTGLKGHKGLTELSRVTVKGTVANHSSPDAFIVNANSIHIGVR